METQPNRTNQWRTAILDRLRRADVEFDPDIKPDDALELIIKQLMKGLKERIGTLGGDHNGFPTGVLILNDMDGLKVEGASSQLSHDDDGGVYPVLILSRQPHTSEHTLYIVLKDPRAFRDFHIALADAATTIMHPDLARDADEEGKDDPSYDKSFSKAAEKFLRLIGELDQNKGEKAPDE